MRFRLSEGLLALLILSTSALAGDWPQFRGPTGMGVSDETGLPAKWSSTDNIVWKAELPGPGASCPVTDGERVFLTCYSGYGLEPNQGDQKDLRRHLLCFRRRTGDLIWKKEFEPKLPEHPYQGEGSYHGYAASTPLIDGQRLYVFFGKSGVYCFDLDGKELWHKSVGENIDRWGSGTSPILYGDFVIVNASIESNSLVALNKADGSEKWRAGGINASWNTPLVVAADGRSELVVSINARILSFDPRDGKPLWSADGIHRYVCPSVVAHAGVIYAIGGGHTSLAVRAGGSGDVTASHELWRQSKGSNVGSPIYLDGHLYWAHDSNGTVCCQNAETGETVFQQRLEPSPDRIWSSPVLADGKLYIVSQRNGTYVVAAKPAFEQLAHNKFEQDDSRVNASPAVNQGQLLLRTDRFLYCIGKK
ncbi:MAG TPA: PQQ-binding-like beta-propeller repeat protein [Planctomycetaceae bacterium]|nr:PQQ-binding-like beta-propeller repeat protein [Planctomycetaceae bacterium]